jgi:hypothetical protein
MSDEKCAAIDNGNKNQATTDQSRSCNPRLHPLDAIQSVFGTPLRLSTV